MTTTDSGLILPPAAGGSDEEIAEWLDLCRGRTIRTSDELGDDAAWLYAILRRYAERKGMNRWGAGKTARAVTLPIARAAESLERAGSYFRVAERRLEAYVEGFTDPKRYADEFTIRGRR